MAALSPALLCSHLGSPPNPCSKLSGPAEGCASHPVFCCSGSRAVDPPVLPLVHMVMYPSVHPLVHMVMYPPVHPLVHVPMHPSVHPLVHMAMHCPVHPLLHVPMHSPCASSRCAFALLVEGSCLLTAGCSTLKAAPSSALWRRSQALLFAMPSNASWADKMHRTMHGHRFPCAEAAC